LDDAALWEQHINKTQHCRTDIIPIYGESWTFKQRVKHQVMSLRRL
jgi:hypothetical protein